MKEAARKSIAGYLWTGLAVLVCPCHLPILVGALAGTTVGALVSNHWVVALFSLVALFFFSATRAWMALSEGSCGSRCEEARGPALGADKAKRRTVKLRDSS
nr:broad-spectrum mercury transporter MerE [Thiomonas sp. FB-Cd]